MQSPDNVYRQRKDSNIRHDVWDSIPDERPLEVDTCTRQTRMPGFSDRVALKHAHADDGDHPGDGDSTDDE